MSKEKNNEVVQEALQQLQQGVQEFMTSERFAEYLRVMSKFHNYSFNNTILIALQKPDASLVHGYRAWQRDFGRFVRKGERGIRIFAPMPMKRQTEHEALDPDTGKPVLYEDGSPVKVEASRVIQRYKVATVFDVSQTEGEPLPALAGYLPTQPASNSPTATASTTGMVKIEKNVLRQMLLTAWV